MGFEKNRAKKALLLHKMNFNFAMEFLLVNIGNPYLDQPLTINEITSIYEYFKKRGNFFEVILNNRGT
jgi:uncharacterized UBP type Zn finger protein